jgi:hypothetical protein
MQPPPPAAITPAFESLQKSKFFGGEGKDACYEVLRNDSRQWWQDNMWAEPAGLKEEHKIIWVRIVTFHLVSNNMHN